MKKLILTIGVSFLGAMAFAGKLTVTSADGLTLNDYDTFTDACNSCTGGETITFNENVEHAIGANFGIAAPNLTIDLNGKTMSIDAGCYFHPLNGADGLTFKNGTIDSYETLLYIQENSDQVGTIYFDNCRIEHATCVAYASYGKVIMNDCVVCGKLVVSQGCQNTAFSFEATDCVLAPYGGATENGVLPNIDAKLYGGYTNFDPSNWLGDGFVCTPSSSVQQGCNCTYVISKADEAPDILEVISADGVTTNVYKTIDGALADFGEGETLRFLTGLDITSAIFISKPNMTIDLNGYTLNRPTGGDFLVIGGGATGFTLRNGSTMSVNSLTNTKGSSGLGDIYFIDLEIGGQCAVYGDYGTFNFSNVVVTADYFVSQGCSTPVNVNFAGGVIAPRINPTDSAQDPMYTPATVKVSGGYFTFNPSGWLAPNCYMRSEETTVEGIVCSYAVYEAEEALDVAEVVTIAGVTNGYKSVAEALENVGENETVRLLANWKVEDDADTIALNIAQSMMIDLNGFTMENTSGNFMTLDGDVTLTLRNGTICQQGNGSLFILENEGSAVVCDNCTIRGYCLIYGTRGNQLTLTNVMTIISYLTSGGGNAHVDIIGGKHNMARYHDGDGDVTKGTTITLAGGRYSESPLGDERIAFADGYALAYEKLTEGVVVYQYRLIAQEEIAAYPVRNGNGVCYSSLAAAADAAKDGDTLILNADITSHVELSSSTYWENRNLTLDLNGKTISGGGDWGNYVLFWVNQGFSLSITNGTIKGAGGCYTIFVLFSGNNLTLDKSVTITHDESCAPCVFNCPLAANKITVNGTTFEAESLFNANLMDVTLAGDCVCKIDRIFYPQSPIASTDSLVVSGGWWSVDPTDYVLDPKLKVKDYGEDYAAKGKPCRYYVAKPSAGLVILIK